MPEFPKPRFEFEYDVDAEIARLREWRKKEDRFIPAKSNDTLLLATWNIANFGAQDRRDQDRRLIAEILGWFDVVAIQETRSNLADLDAVAALLPRYRRLFTDTAGNDERMVYLYDAKKGIEVREQVGEVAIEPSALRHIKLPGVAQSFNGFDRNPFLASFKFKNANFTLANVHLYFGGTSAQDIQRRQLETFAVARWARGQNQSKTAYDPTIILLGDFNLPHMADDDPIFSVLKRFGLLLTEHSTEIGATLPGEPSETAEEIKHYDQIAFFPGTKALFTGRTGVFDFDSAVFPNLWDERGRKDFNAFIRYYLSDHRPLWAEIKP
jgi:endonuclease/exonuclease/phosphatase family metal-dependent hydrolase